MFAICGCSSTEERCRRLAPIFLLNSLDGSPLGGPRPTPTSPGHPRFCLPGRAGPAACLRAADRRSVREPGSRRRGYVTQPRGPPMGRDPGSSRFALVREGKPREWVTARCRSNGRRLLRPGGRSASTRTGLRGSTGRVGGWGDGAVVDLARGDPPRGPAYFQATWGRHAMTPSVRARTSGEARQVATAS
jgi:hypothetical protein